jgi:FtsZ-binding cell division protein ZapB
MMGLLDSYKLDMPLIWRDFCWITKDISLMSLSYFFLRRYFFQDCVPQIRKQWRERVLPDIQKRGIFTSANLGFAASVAYKGGKAVVIFCTGCVGGYLGFNDYYYHHWGFSPGREIVAYRQGIQDWDALKRHLSNPSDYVHPDLMPWQQEVERVTHERGIVIQDLSRENQGLSWENQDLSRENQGLSRENQDLKRELAALRKG